jgi:4-hydroxythreonine-4-phosphate dehydrogenase
LRFFTKKSFSLVRTLSLDFSNSFLILGFKSFFVSFRFIKIFFKKYLKRNAKIAVTGLNPHCESIDIFNEDEKIVKPAIKTLNKSNFKVSGPFAADTIFLKNNRKQYNVIIGMYHDQVLTPIKTLFEYDAINITLGLPFLRISPDHGPNEKMMGKNKSNSSSLVSALTFLDFKK